MTTEDLIELLKQHPGKEVFVSSDGPYTPVDEIVIIKDVYRYTDGTYHTFPEDWDNPAEDILVIW